MARRSTYKFRASLLIRGAVLLALLLWLATLVFAVRIEAPLEVFAAIVFFVFFFLAFGAYYFSMSYTVEEDGLTYRGATGGMHVDWDEIVKVEMSAMPLGGWYVTTKTGGFVLSSFLTDARDLAELVAARAGLMPQRA